MKRERERKRREMLPYERTLNDFVPFQYPKYVSSPHAEHQCSMKRHILRMARSERLPVYLFINERDLAWCDDVVSDIAFTLGKCQVRFFVSPKHEKEISCDVPDVIRRHANGRIIHVDALPEARPFVIAGSEGVCFLSDEDRWTDTRYVHEGLFAPSLSLDTHHSEPVQGMVSMNCSSEGDVMRLLSCLILKEPVASLLCPLYIPLHSQRS